MSKVDECIDAIKANPTMTRADIAEAVGCTTRTVNNARAIMRTRQDDPPTTTPPNGGTINVRGGFSLEGKEVLAKRPTSVWPARFRALRRGIGYRVETLAEQYGVSAATVKEKAQQHRCLRYVEECGEYVACVVHPTTQGGK